MIKFYGGSVSVWRYCEDKQTNRNCQNILPSLRRVSMYPQISSACGLRNAQKNGSLFIKMECFHVYVRTRSAYGSANTDGIETEMQATQGICGWQMWPHFPIEPQGQVTGCILNKTRDPWVSKLS